MVNQRRAQGRQASRTEEKLCRCVLVGVPLIPPVESQGCYQVAVIWQAAHRLSLQRGDAAAERTNQSIRGRLSQVQDLDETFGTETVAAVQHLWPATPQVVHAVADLTLQLLCTVNISTAALL